MWGVLLDRFSTGSVEAGTGSAMFVLLSCSDNKSTSHAEVGNESGMLASRMAAVFQVG
jgi:hypothetical protein